ncbi:MAG: hypothetical protein IH830_13635 [Planctomycetes bacterium]|nr:hypothetical protein [Planctomycetota bacterium]
MSKRIRWRLAIVWAAVALTAGLAAALHPQHQHDQAHETRSGRTWTPDDLVVDPFGDPQQFAELWRQTAGGAASTVGSMDIGEIAVLQDDGSLVQGNVTNTPNIIQAFYATHGDEYDQVIIHVASTYRGDVDPEAGFAFFSLVAGYVGGINRFQGNPAEEFGITRLIGICNMNDLPEYPQSPTEDFFGDVASYVEILGQEFEHAWAAFVQPAPGTGADILGRSDAHWSFFLNHPGIGNASPMEGNRWQANGDGSFTTVESFTGFGELDDYLMGLRAPMDMVPFYVIDFPPGRDPFDDGAFPEPGVTVTGGTPIDLTIQDIIDNYGPRGPDTTTSMKTFKIAFILVIPPDSGPDPADLKKLDDFRLAWEAYFNHTTEGLGTMDTRLGIGPGVDPSVFAQVDDFESQTIDPTRYQYVQGATISDLGLNEPSGANALRLNGNWGGGDEVRSVPIDLAGLPFSSVTLHYSVQRTGGGDSPELGDDLLIEYFNNVGQWIVLRTIVGWDKDQTQFTAFDDILPTNGLHEQFRFRFRRLQGDIAEVDDYFVDDVFLTIADTCPADLDDDDTVGILDLLALLADWGDCPVKGDCSADLNGDGNVGILDLLVLLANWGPCP